VPQDAGNHIFNITVSDSAAAVGRNFTLQVNASDPDGDRITYSDDTGLFDINGTTGLIEFTPGSDQVGTHFVNITVSDGVIIRNYIGKDEKHSNNEKIH